ncbi:hypothetical protein BDQ17DRAFT_719137 [Cyathus striatus]|nr:hypothetical protein BDQ17DRAFT_719137 [Cyathus striatus]
MGNWCQRNSTWSLPVSRLIAQGFIDAPYKRHTIHRDHIKQLAYILPSGSLYYAVVDVTMKNRDEKHAFSKEQVTTLSARFTSAHQIPRNSNANNQFRDRPVARKAVGVILHSKSRDLDFHFEQQNTRQQYHSTLHSNTFLSINARRSGSN